MRAYEHAHMTKKYLGNGMRKWEDLSDDEIVLLCYYFKVWCLSANIDDDYLVDSLSLYIPDDAKWKGKIENSWRKK